MLCLDDLQWCDSAILALIKEIIVSVAQLRRGSRHFLFVGTYRDDDKINSHLLRKELTSLQRNESVNVTELKLSSLSKNDVATMVIFDSMHLSYCKS